MKRIVSVLASISVLGLLVSACSSTSSTPGAPPNPAGPVGNPNSTNASQYTLQTTASVPKVPWAGSPLAANNASWVDISIIDTGGTGFYAVADKANAGVSLINPATNTYVSTAGSGKMGGFGLAIGANRTGGPNGIVSVGNGNIFVGDANSNLQVVNTATGTVVSPTAGCTSANLVTTATSLPGNAANPNAASGGLVKTASGATICGWYTGGFFRLDEGAYDPADGIVVMGNDEDSPNPFLTFFSSTACATTTATNAQCILGTLVLTNAISSTNGGGLEQPVWDSAQRVFLVSVPQTGTNAGGEVDMINATTRSIVKTFAAPAGCAPAGLALKQSTEVLLIGCGGPNVTFMSATTGAILGQVAVGGCDEVWYNPTDDRFYAACSNNTTNATGPSGGVANPVAAVMDGTKLNLITVLPTTASAHSVAADPVTNKLFVPVIFAPTSAAGNGAGNGFPGGVSIWTHN